MTLNRSSPPSSLPLPTASTAEIKPVFWLFHIGTKAERKPLDCTTSIFLLIIFVLAIISHIPSFALLIKDIRHRYSNNAILIYKHLFFMDLIIIFGYLPSDALWTITRQSIFLCRLNRMSLFTGFFGAYIFLIILAVDRYMAIFTPLKHLTARYKRGLSLSLWVTWAFALGMGLWQGSVHRVGPSLENRDYNLCGATTDVAKSIFTPIAAGLTFVPLVVTISINSLISCKLLWRDCELEGCAGCRLQGGACPHHLAQGCLSLTRERARLERLLKMKTVRMTGLMAFCFTICQVPMAALYLVAWQDTDKAAVLPPVVVELCQAVRTFYVVIVPLLHGSVMERSAMAQTSYKLTFSRPPSVPVVYSLNA